MCVCCVCLQEDEGREFFVLKTLIINVEKRVFGSLFFGLFVFQTQVQIMIGTYCVIEHERSDKDILFGRKSFFSFSFFLITHGLSKVKRVIGR